MSILSEKTNDGKLETNNETSEMMDLRRHKAAVRDSWTAEMEETAYMVNILPTPNITALPMHDS